MQASVPSRPTATIPAALCLMKTFFSRLCTYQSSSDATNCCSSHTHLSCHTDNIVIPTFKCLIAASRMEGCSL